MKRYGLTVLLVDYANNPQRFEFSKSIVADELHDVLLNGFEAVCHVHTAAKAVADSTPQRPE